MGAVCPTSVLTAHRSCLYTNGHIQTYRTPEASQVERQSSYNTLSHQLPDPHSPLLTKHRHSCVQSPRMLTKPLLHTTHRYAQTHQATLVPIPHRCKTRQNPLLQAHNLQVTYMQVHTDAMNLQSHFFPHTPPAPSIHSLPATLGSQAATQFCNFSGEAKVAFSCWGVVMNRAAGARSVEGAKGGRLYPYVWAPHTKSSCRERRPPWARSCAEAATAQLIELGRSGPATRAPPAVRSASSPRATQARTGCRGMD